MTLSILLVSYNTKDLTLQTLESVYSDISSSKKLHNTTEIIVIDNNSSDGSVPAIKTFFLNQKNTIITHKIISLQDNLGFAKANNLGIEKSKGAFILLLNSDTIVQKGALQSLLTNIQSTHTDETTAYVDSHKNDLDKLGILAASLLNPDGTPQPQGGSFPTLFSLFTHMTFLDDLPVIGRFFPSTQHTGKNSRDYSKTNKPIQQDWVGGTAMLFKKEVLTEIGPLDPNIFMYGEDMEICMRAKYHHWDIAIDPSAEIIHLGSASSSSENAILGEFKGYIYIWSKHKPQWQIPILKAVLKLGAFLRIILFSTIVKNPKKSSIYKKALKVI